jgi:hypothetical protein
MRKLLRDKAPFIMLGITIVVTLLSYLDIYFTMFRYLPDLIGYSLLTNLFMLSVYMNKRYCDATKICVLGLIALNMFNLISHGSGFYSPIYDLYLCAAILCVLGGYALQRKK